MKKDDRSFLIINPFGIGDVLFSTPLIRNIRESFPESKVFYLCNRRTQPILESNPLIAKVFVYERDEFEEVKRKSKFLWLKKINSFISGIKREAIGTVLDLSLNSQFGFFAWAAGIKQRIGYNYKKRGFFLTRKIKLAGYKNKHVTEYYLDLLKLIAVTPAHNKLELFLPSPNKEGAVNFLKDRGVGADDLVVVITPCGGASWARQSFYKHWPQEKFAQLADRLIEDFKAKVILAGDSSEERAINNIANRMSFKPVKALGLPLLDFLALLERAAVLIANDGGPIHMGVALGLKTVSIFGPVDEKVYGPYPSDAKRHIVIKKDLACRPCYRNFRLSECRHDRRCLAEIGVEEVREAVEKLIS